MLLALGEGPGVQNVDCGHGKASYGSGNSRPSGKGDGVTPSMMAQPRLLVWWGGWGCGVVREAGLSRNRGTPFYVAT